MVNRLLDRLSFMLFPGCCLICTGPSQRRLDLCDACETEFPKLTTPCPRCAYPSTSTDNLCGQCLLQTPSFCRTLALWHYHPPIDSLISQFKYHKRFSNGRVMGQLLTNHVQHHYRPEHLPDWIAPVPMHWRRKLSRGFNHGEQLAEQLALTLDLPLLKGLSRIRNSPPQQGLSAGERRQNLRHAFKLKQPHRLQGQSIALVDDVMTTGSTAEEISQLLLQAGATEVHIWCLARTPLS